MCNVCNSYGYNTATASTSGSWNGCGCNQSICRDCGGNIHIHNYRCCRPCSCGCNNGGNTGNGGSTSTNGNGYGCITVCGAAANAVPASTANTATTAASSYDEYYARQYALNGRSNRCRR